MKIAFVYELTDSTIQQRWIAQGAETAKRQRFEVESEDLKRSTRKLMTDLGFAAQNGKWLTEFDMRWKKSAVLFSSAVAYSVYIQLDAEITNERELRAALKLLKTMREREEREQAAKKAADEAAKQERAANEAQAAAAKAEREQQRKATEEALDLARTAWIDQYGSAHLKALWPHRGRWDSALEMYEQERAALEYPGAYVDTKQSISTNRVELPSEAALDWFEHGLTQEVRDRSFIAEVYQVRYAVDDELVGCEVIEVNDPNYTFVLYVKVNSALPTDHPTAD